MARIFRGKIPDDLQGKVKARRKRRGLSLDSIGWRLELYRFHLGLKSQDMAELLNISQGSFSELQSDKSQPSCQTIIKFYNLNENPVDVLWLLIGHTT